MYLYNKYIKVVYIIYIYIIYHVNNVKFCVFLDIYLNGII